ncbi:DUF2809 domain-containing protein [Cellulomonas endometrii]|uniref:DUF2809 domain-containing protein n=1 Tax=Cellulomonas endometrii TaxID=3036301 RepID=UPI0024AC8C2E|nr:DUF2809 domain-containing protein [Cellulomonas endometrii]
MTRQSTAAQATATRPRVRRPWGSTAAAGGLVVAAGLASARSGSGPVGDALGDALYAALVLLLVRLAWPGLRRRTQAVIAVGLCWAVEAAQATGGPAAAVRAWAPLRYLLGTTFVATDLLWYAAGVLLTSGLVTLASRWWGGTRRAARARA